jgi:hypothetical protein
MEPGPPLNASARAVRLTPAGLLLRTVRVWARNAPAFTAVGLIVYLPVAALEVRGGLLAKGAEPSLLLLLFAWFLEQIGSGALSIGVLRSLRGQPMGAGPMLTGAVRQAWPILAVAGVYTATVVVGLILIVPGVFALVVGFVAVPAIVDEPALGIEGALRRSWTLTDGNRLALLGAIAFLFVIKLAAGVGTQILLDGATSFPPIARAAVQTLVAGLVIGLTNCCAAVAYHELRAAPPPRPG